MRCNDKLIHCGDHDYEDYGIEGDGIVSNLTCNNCNAFVLVHVPDDWEYKSIE